MIPQKLSIQGLYSYQAKVDIDFSILSAAKLFGIFGHVGSGKSAILEAITFVLYGKTDRLNLSGDSRNYNMMNLKSDKLLIDFEFASGPNKEQFRATAKSHRNRNNFDDVKAIERTAYKETNGEWIPIELDQLELVVDLSYDNFRRTIIIPQGKFQEFLQLGRSDRTQMMKELFNLGKYELFYKTASLESKNNENINILEGQLQQLGEINVEQLDELKSEHKLKEEKLKNLIKRQEIKQKEKLSQDRLKELITQKLQLETNSSQLQTRQEEINQLEKRIADYEYCSRAFEGLFRSQLEAVKAKESYSNQLEKNTNEQTRLSEQIKSKTKEVEELKPQVEKRDQIFKEVEELSKIGRVLGINKVLIRLEAEIQKDAKLNEENVSKSTAITAKQKELEQNLKKLKENMPDLTVLYKIKVWHSTNLAFSKNKESLDAEHKKTEQKRKAIIKQLLDLYAKEVFKGMAVSEEPKVGVQWFQDKKTRIAKELKELNNKIETLVVKQKLEEYAHALHEGEACPLCGSDEHPEILNVENVSHELDACRKKQKAIENEIVVLQNGVNFLTGIQTQLDGMKESKEELDAKLKELIKNIENHAAAFLWKEYRDEKELEKAYQDAEQIQSNIKKLEKEQHLYTQSIEELNGRIISHEAKLKSKEQEKVSKSTEKRTYLEQIEHLSYCDYENTPVEEINRLAEKKKAKIAQLVSQFDALTKHIADLQKQADNLAGQIAADTKSLNGIISQLKELNEKISEQLKLSKWEGLDEVAKILAAKIDIDTERKKINDFNLAVKSNNTKLDDVVKEIAGRAYIQEAHIKLLNEVSELENEFKLLNQQLGGLKNKINTLENALKQHETLMKKLAVLKVRAEDIRVIKQMFKASGFVEYISAVYLENLCRTANERFQKMTRQQLSLELSEGNSFQVRDFMNGGKVRSVKTLSGGQTFQAALSMALALADNIQKTGGTDENFFFLDEGFGSLDKEALQVVFETLKSLRKENRIVGVISHVEELQQEIPSYLVVENNEETGSSVKASWTR